MNLEIILLIALTVLCTALLILLIVSFVKRPKGFENLSSVITETKKQNEYLEKTIKNLFEVQFNSIKQFNEFVISTIKNYNDNVFSFFFNSAFKIFNLNFHFFTITSN